MAFQARSMQKVAKKEYSLSGPKVSRALQQWTIFGLLIPRVAFLVSTTS